MPVAWEEAFEGFEPEEKGGGKGGGTGNGHAKPLRFQIKPFEAIKLSTEPSYRVKGILPRVGLVVVWGPPKCGKSFWTFDTIMHIALGWQYRGRKVQQGRVVYLALEGGPGFARRVEAWRRRHLADHDGLVPFSLIDVPVDLVADHKALISDIEAQVNEPPPSSSSTRSTAASPAARTSPRTWPNTSARPTPSAPASTAWSSSFITAAWREVGRVGTRLSPAPTTPRSPSIVTRLATSRSPSNS
jgi:hypothetical protein